MELLFQLIDAVLAEYIYGTPTNPRPTAMRIAVRAAVLAGAVLVAALLLGFIRAEYWLIGVGMIWFVGTVVIMGAEFRLGSPHMYFVILGVLLGLAGLAIFAL